MERMQAAQILEELEQEARRLAQGDTILDAAFHSWHQRTLTALDEIYGYASSQRGEFAAIRYEQDPSVFDAAERHLRQQAREIGADINDLRIDLYRAQKHYYQERLAEAAEVLLSFIISLRA